MTYKKYYSMFLLLILFLFIDTSTTFAHSGRTDSYGCHTDHSTGEYHCHNGGSSNSSTTNNYNSQKVYDYKDNDRSGVNDYNQDWDDLAKNLKEMGYNEGYADAEYGSYEIELDNFSMAEYREYELGYEEGYKKKYNEIKDIAKDEGYESGLIFNELDIPSKFTISEEIENLYEEGFMQGKEEAINSSWNKGYESGLETDEINIPKDFQEPVEIKYAYEDGITEGQITRWSKVVEEQIANYEPLRIPNTLSHRAKKRLQSIYNKEIDPLKEIAYNEGYADAFKTDKLDIPSQYENKRVLDVQYRTGFNSNKEIDEYKTQAYEAGKNGEGYRIPNAVKEDGAEAFYEEYYKEGKEQRVLTIVITLKHAIS